MFLNNVTSDGNQTEGIGSVLSFKLISYALSKIYGLKFIDNKIKNIVGGNFMGLSNETYDEKINEFFSFDYENSHQESKKKPFDIMFDHTGKMELSKFDRKLATLKRNFFYNSFSNNIKKIQHRKILSKLGTQIAFESNEKYFKDGLNIVIQIRAPLKDIDVRFETSRRYFYGSFRDLDKINNLIRQLEHSEKNVKLNFHIVTLGDKKLFQNVSPMYDKNELFIHSDLDIFETFSMMIHNDVFIGGYSNLSYIAHLLRDNRTIFPLDFEDYSFVKKPYPNLVTLNEIGLVEGLNYNKGIKKIIQKK